MDGVKTHMNWDEKDGVDSTLSGSRLATRFTYVVSSEH